MSTRKNIDKLYLRKFENAEAAPPEAAWENILSRLPEQEKKKRFFPFWFRYAGAAAILLLLVSLGFNFFSTETSAPKLSNSVSRQDIHNTIRLSSSSFTETMLEVSMSLQDMMQRENSSPNKPSHEDGINEEESTLAFTETSAQNSSLGKMVTENRGEVVQQSIITEAAESEPAYKNEIALAGNVEEVSSQPDAREELPVDEIQEENALARQLAAELSPSEEDPEEAATGRLSISTRVAPVFYEKGGENAVSATMGGAESSGEVSISYGISLAYQVSDKIKIRSGISKLDLSFSKPNVPMAAVMNSGNLFDEKKDPSLVSSFVTGDLQQEMNFIEVPVEVEYRLLDSKIGLNLIAGGSTLFLNQNNLSMDTGVRTTDLGQSESLKNLNFSANVGLGLDYQLAPQFRLSLEPMFKYQLDSFSEETGVRPYYMAIYSGLSISF